MCSCNKVLVIFALLGLVVAILGAVLGFAVFGNIVEGQIEDKVELRYGTEQFERWTELPFPLTFKVHIFNVKNPDEVTHNGAVPSVEERGPYVYRQYRHKEDIEYDEDEDVLSYKPFQRYEYDAEASAPFSEDDVLTVLNVPMQGIFQSLTDDNVGLGNNVWGRAFPDTVTLFHRVSVKDYLFNGYRFCSTMSGTSGTVVNIFCNQIKDQTRNSKTLEVVGDSVQFSFFNHKNNSHDGVYEIMAGLDNARDVGEIISWQGETKISAWVGEDSTCNRIRGRDSSIYPPFIEESSLIEVFNTDICRIIRLDHDGTAEFEGIEGHVRRMGKEAMSNTGDQECYCTKQSKNLYGQNECLPEGFGDMRSCLGSPVITSFPHLLWADESYQRTVEGLNPDPNLHTTFVNIEPGTGSPLQGAKRIQFNMFIRPIERIVITQNVRPAVLPILWIEEGVELSSELIEQLKSDYLDKLVVLDVITWVLMGVGLAVFVGCSLGYFFRRKSN